MPVQAQVSALAAAVNALSLTTAGAQVVGG